MAERIAFKNKSKVKRISIMIHINDNENVQLWMLKKNNNRASDSLVRIDHYFIS